MSFVNRLLLVAVDGGVVFVMFAVVAGLVIDGTVILVASGGFGFAYVNNTYTLL